MVVGAANRIPFEIWLQIRDFIGPADSSSLYSVNRTWFEMVMNARYQVLDITRLNEDVVSRLPLLRDRGISKRVRHLSISGLALQTSLLGTITGQRVRFPMDRNTLSILNRRIRALDATSVLNPQVRLISEVLTSLNVSEYAVKWDFHEGIQSGELIHSPLQAAILDVAWPAFGTSLKKLYVSTRPERFNAVLSSDVRLMRLEEIYLELFHTSNGTQSIGMQDVSFFARINPHLDTLSIHSSSNLNLSCLFRQLPSFTHLRRLLLHIFLDHGVLSDPAGLESFFAHSALQLRHLTLFLYHAAVASAERVLPSLALHRARIPCLQTLEINFGMPYPGLATTLLCELHNLFNDARGTLHTLVLEGIALSHADLETVTSAFAERDVDDTLQSVTLSLLTLTPRHIDTLAKNLRCTSVVGIIFTHLSLVSDSPPAPESESRVNFKKEVQKRKYPNWKLRDISIWHHSRSVDTSRWDLVSLFPACVPTIDRFFGHILSKPTQTATIVPRMLHALTEG